jgi:hypothetical protein
MSRVTRRQASRVVVFRNNINNIRLLETDVLLLAYWLASRTRLFRLNYERTNYV